MNRIATLRGALLLTTLFAATEESAVADDLDGLYVGGNFGRIRNAYNTGFLDSQLLQGATAAGDTLDIEKRSTSRLSYAWSADAGYFFSPNVGVEAAFFHLGEVKYIVVGTLNNGGDIRSVSSTAEITSHGPAISLVLRAPLSEAFETDLRLGDYYGKTTFDNNVSVGANSNFVGPSKSASSLLVGLGAAYSVAGHYSIRLDYLRIEKAGGDATGGTFNENLVTAGLSYTF